MEDAGKYAKQLGNLSISESCARKGSRETACLAGSATVDDFSTATTSEQATTSHSVYATANIELSKYHWSERVEIDCNSTDDEIAADNLEVFESLQKHPRWGEFFITFGYDTEVRDRSGEMVVGEKFAEGGQAELFRAHITWTDTRYNEYCEEEGMKWVLKVFKKRTLLRQLQSLWPQGYLEFWANDNENQLLSYPQGIRWHCKVMYGILMEDGRFAFLMLKESRDLRSQIDENMVKIVEDGGPFSRDEVVEIMYRIARGVNWLHGHDIIHRDIKASNVLVRDRYYFIADFECSVGVAGTGFWRAPEILQACKDYTVNQRPDLFTKASDVYSYGMTCYEILTGKFPFKNEGVTISDIIKGKHPHVPEFVDVKYKDLLYWCWQLDPTARPSFGEILSFLESNSKSYYIRMMTLERMKDYESGYAVLGCTIPSHTLALRECATNEGGMYVCKLCLEIGNGDVYHCDSCGDFDLHLECARLPIQLISLLHPHELDIVGPYNITKNYICHGCFEDLEGSQWTYWCRSGGCDFDLHARCGKYAATIFHASHKEHKLLLISNSSVESSNGSEVRCDGCKIGIRLKELVYHCKECKFNIHANCAIGNVVGS